MSLPAFLADTLARWGAMMQRPLHEPTPVPPAPRDWAGWRLDVDRAIAAAEPALLPSTDYRTNPRPVQVPVVAPAPTLDALRAGLLARGPRGDALRAAVARATIKDL